MFSRARGISMFFPSKLSLDFVTSQPRRQPSFGSVPWTPVSNLTHATLALIAKWLDFLFLRTLGSLWFYFPRECNNESASWPEPLDDFTSFPGLPHAGRFAATPSLSIGLRSGTPPVHLRDTVHLVSNSSRKESFPCNLAPSIPPDVASKGTTHGWDVSSSYNPPWCLYNRLFFLSKSDLFIHLHTNYISPKELHLLYSLL